MVPSEEQNHEVVEKLAGQRAQGGGTTGEISGERSGIPGRVDDQGYQVPRGDPGFGMWDGNGHWRGKSWGRAEGGKMGIPSSLPSGGDKCRNCLEDCHGAERAANARHDTNNGRPVSATGPAGSGVRSGARRGGWFDGLIHIRSSSRDCRESGSGKPKLVDRSEESPRGTGGATVTVAEWRTVRSAHVRRELLLFGRDFVCHVQSYAASSFGPPPTG
ncbi:hypothetical protein IWZ01DRAFT_242999 [Phyllosticta capitalensis]